MEIINLLCPMIMFAYFLYRYNGLNKRWSFLKYICFAMFPYITDNPSSMGSVYIIITNVLIVMMIVYELVKKIKGRCCIAIPKSVIWLFFFASFVTIMGLLLTEINSDFLSGIRNLFCFSLFALLMYIDIAEYKDEVQKVATINLKVMVVLGILNLLIVYVTTGFIVRVTANASNTNFYALLLLMYLFFAYDEDNFKMNSLFAFSLVGVLLTQSLAGILALFIWILPLKKWRRIIPKLFFILTVGIIAFIVYVRLYNLDLYSTLFKSQYDRMAIWAIYLNGFKENPLFGVGYNKFNAQFMGYTENLVSSDWVTYLTNGSVTRLASHNDLIKILAETGVVGFLIFVIFFVKVIQECIEINEEKMIKFVMIGMLFIISHNLIDGYYAWLIFFVPVIYADRINNVRIRL